VDYVKQGDYTVRQAMDAAADILFNNSNRLYGLGLRTPTMSESVASMPVAPIKSLVTSGRSVLDAMLQSHPNSFVWIQFIDYTATVRVRMFPIREFIKIVQNQRRLGISCAVLNMLQDDYLAPGGSPAGQFYLEPDLSTLCRNAGVVSNSATVMTFWRTEQGDAMQGCPRTTLQAIITKLKNEFQLSVRFGFEIEVVLLESTTDEDGDRRYDPLTTVHSWSNMTAETRKVLPLLEEIVTTLGSIGLHVEQFHSESSPGQFEFILPHESPLLAVDRLIKARQTINHVVEKHGYRATLYPRPYPMAAGTAAHAHFSISPATDEASFLAGILEHFPAVVAFSLSQEISYARVAAGIWSGGEWVTWGTQNRETPIRQIAPGHWEMKSLDGLANMYLAMAALMAAGYLGVSSKTPLNMKDCTGIPLFIIHILLHNEQALTQMEFSTSPDDPSTLTPEQRSSLGIATAIPKTLEQSLSALEANNPLQHLLGPELVKNYCQVKRAETAKLAAMPAPERRKFLLERY
jgi:glutamine synthetase